MKPWPHLPSDPRLYYFAVPNEIFRSEITACEFSILAYLFSRQMKKTTPANLMTVKMNLSLSRNTMKKYVRILESRGLISLQHDKRFLRASVSMRDTITLTDVLKVRVCHFFPLPNSVFSFGLSAGELAVYGYLLYREDRESYECWPSYRTIGAALCMSRNTVMKYVHRLEEKEFIVTEPTQVKRSDGFKWNSNLNTMCAQSNLSSMPGMPGRRGQQNRKACCSGPNKLQRTGQDLRSAKVSRKGDGRAHFRSLFAVVRGKQDIGRGHRPKHISRQSRLLRGF